MKQITAHAAKVQNKVTEAQLKGLKEIMEPGSTDILMERGRFTDKQVLFMLVVVAFFAWAFGHTGGKADVEARVMNHANTCWRKTALKCTNATSSVLAVDCRIARALSLPAVDTSNQPPPVAFSSAFVSTPVVQDWSRRNFFFRPILKCGMKSRVASGIE